MEVMLALFVFGIDKEGEVMIKGKIYQKFCIPEDILAFGNRRHTASGGNSFSDKIVFGHFCEGCRKTDRRESEGGRGFRI